MFATVFLQISGCNLAPFGSLLAYFFNTFSMSICWWFFDAVFYAKIQKMVPNESTGPESQASLFPTFSRPRFWHRFFMDFGPLLDAFWWICMPFCYHLVAMLDVFCFKMVAFSASVTNFGKVLFLSHIGHIIAAAITTKLLLGRNPPQNVLFTIDNGLSWIRLRQPKDILFQICLEIVIIPDAPNVPAATRV